MTWGFSSVQWPTPPYWGQGQVPSCWSRSPEGQGVCALPASSTSTLAQVWSCISEQTEQLWVLSIGLGMGCGGPGCSQSLGPLLMCSLPLKASHGCPHLVQVLEGSEPALPLTTEHSPWLWQPSLLCGAKQARRSRHWAHAGVCTGVVVGNWPESRVVLICFFFFSHIVLGVSKTYFCMHTFYKQILGFLQPSC